MNIFKTWKKNIYFKGFFKLRNKNENWVTPIDFPTVFEGYGKAIKSGNWQRCTGINNPEYVVKNYFDNNESEMFELWRICKELENITWDDVFKNEVGILKLVDLANNELKNLKTLN